MRRIRRQKAVVPSIEMAPSDEQLKNFVQFMRDREIDLLKDTLKEKFGGRLLCVLDNAELKQALTRECLKWLKFNYTYFFNTASGSDNSYLIEIAEECSQSLMPFFERRRKWMNCSKKDEVVQKLMEAKENKDGEFGFWLK